MKQVIFLVFIAVLASCSTDSKSLKSKDPILKTEISSPEIELVFCLDATGSMSGLIQTAKDKIWDIISGIAEGESAPNIRLGMVFYRDRDDDFVTKVYDLTQDIDSLYIELQGIHARGGGDTPESVNLALYEAIENISWSKKKNKKVFRTVFLVGDCPPHMDYPQEKEYPEICKIAAKKGIVINTIKLGNSCKGAIEHFKAISAKTNGNYLHLDQNATDVVIQTPYDDSINQYSYQIDNSKMYYGTASVKSYNGSKKEATLADFYTDADVVSNSSRATYNGSSSGKSNWFGDQEIIQKLADKKIKLESIKEE